jgi:hypothetical protein
MTAQTDFQCDPLLAPLIAGIADVPGVAAIVLGGSRARGTSHRRSDYDIGLYFSDACELDTDRLQDVVRGFTDDPETTTVTPVGAWGPWIVGGAWLTVGGEEVDLLYRNIDAVRRTMDDCRSGQISIDYQPGHPHGFCSATWMGELARCQPLRDPGNLVAELKAITMPYPEPLRDALIRRFRWEILFTIENAEIASRREDQTHVAGCAYRALACTAQVLFALNGQYLVNEKAALEEAADFHLTVPELREHVAVIWRRIGSKAFESAISHMRELEREVTALDSR